MSTGCQMITTTMRITLNLHQNHDCSLFAFLLKFVIAGLTLSIIATYSALGVFVYYYASLRTLNSPSNEYCQVVAK